MNDETSTSTYVNVNVNRASLGLSVPAMLDRSFPLCRGTRQGLIVAITVIEDMGAPARRGHHDRPI
jgi:hypothetical protein